MRRARQGKQGGVRWERLGRGNAIASREAGFLGARRAVGYRNW